MAPRERPALPAAAGTRLLRGARYAPASVPSPPSLPFSWLPAQSVLGPFSVLLPSPSQFHSGFPRQGEELLGDATLAQLFQGVRTLLPLVQ